MFAQAISQIPHAQVVVPAAFIFLLVVLQPAVQFFSKQSRRLRHLPQVSEKDDLQLREEAKKAFNKYGKAGEYYNIHDQAHQMVIIPPRLMNELKALPQTVVSFSEEIYERFTGEFTGIGRFEPSFIKTISGDLTKRIPRMMGELAEEIEYGFNGLMGDSGKPKAITMLPAAQRLVALLSSRVLVGDELCHNEEWLESAIVHTNYAFGASAKIWKYPSWLRHWVAPYIKDFRDMRANEKKVQKLLAPEIMSRQKAAFEEEDEFADILQRLIQNAPADKKADVAYHAHNQLELSAVGLHTTAQMITQMIFNLAAYPEHCGPLREELKTVLSAGFEPRTLVMTKNGLAKLVKLDSFMKETQRTNPLSMLSMNRKVMAPNGHTMSNGLHLPKGQFTAINSYHIMNDPDVFPDPDKFDGFRFVKMAAKGGANASKWQFTTVNPEFPAFGLGTHSCPGRFFAGVEIKTVLAWTLLNYDVSFETGQTRPANKLSGHFQSPNGQAKIVFTPLSEPWRLIGDEEE